MGVGVTVDDGMGADASEASGARGARCAGLGWIVGRVGGEP